jgi:hypothetical protein
MKRRVPRRPHTRWPATQAVLFMHAHPAVGPGPGDEGAALAAHGCAQAQPLLRDPARAAQDRRRGGGSGYRVTATQAALLLQARLPAHPAAGPGAGDPGQEARRRPRTCGPATQAAPWLQARLPAHPAAGCGAGDEDAEVAAHVVAAAQALGALVAARRWLPLAAQAAGAAGAPPERRACALVVLSALLFGAGAARPRCGAGPGLGVGSLCERWMRRAVCGMRAMPSESRPCFLAPGRRMCGIPAAVALHTRALPCLLAPASRMPPLHWLRPAGGLLRPIAAALTK